MTNENNNETKAKELQNLKIEALMGELELSVDRMRKSSRSRGRAEGVLMTLGGMALGGLIAWGISKRK